MSRKKLYIILSLGLAAGFAYILYEIIAAGRSSLPDLCLFRHVTGIACPSCGSTRSVIAIMNGRFHEAIMLNPAGFLIAAIMLSVPLWISLDLATGRQTLLDFYIRTEAIIRKPLIAAMLICLVLANWIWNIQKGI